MSWDLLGQLSILTHFALMISSVRSEITKPRQIAKICRGCLNVIASRRTLLLQAQTLLRQPCGPLGGPFGDPRILHAVAAWEVGLQI
jgi:hypothetical protein